MKTTEKIARRVGQTGSRLCIGLDLGAHNASLWAGSSPEAFNRRVIAATHPFAAVYKLQLAGYLGLGSAGLAALQTTIEMLKAEHPDIPIILDAKFSDIAVSLEGYVRFAFEVLGVDAVTANPLLGEDACEPLLRWEDKLMYFLASTSNPGSGEFQQFGGASPLYLEIARRVATWNRAGNCGLVVGATHPGRVTAIRAAAPGLPFLVPGLGTQGGDTDATLAAALTGDPAGAVVNVSRQIIQAIDPAEAARHFAATIGMPQPDPQPPTPAAAAILAILSEAGCIQRGEFTLASGQATDIYCDLRLLAGHPASLATITDHLLAVASALSFDIIVTIPTAGLVLGTAFALRTGRPLRYVRAAAKGYGTGRQIEGGPVEAGRRALLLDDVITTGGSKAEAIDLLRSHDAQVEDVLVVVDRRDPAGLPFMGAAVHSLLSLGQIRELWSA